MQTSQTRKLFSCLGYTSNLSIGLRLHYGDKNFCRPRCWNYRRSTHPKFLFQRSCNCFSKFASYWSIRRPRWDSVIGIVTGLWAWRSGVRMMRVKNIVSFPQSIHTGSEAHPASYWMVGNQCCYSGLKRPGSYVDRPLQSSTEFTNVWSYTSVPSIRFHGVGKDKFLFFSPYSEVHNQTTRTIASTQVRRHTSETTCKDS